MKESAEMLEISKQRFELEVAYVCIYSVCDCEFI